MYSLLGTLPHTLGLRMPGQGYKEHICSVSYAMDATTAALYNVLRNFLSA